MLSHPLRYASETAAISSSPISTSTSGTCQSGIFEELRVGRDLLGGPLVLADRPDVEPDTRPRVHGDLAARLEHGVDHIGEVEMALRDQLDDIRVVDVDAHTHVKAHGGLFDVRVDEP